MTPGITPRRLLERSELVALVNLPEPKVQWLIDTAQLQPIRICGEERFDSRDVDRLITTYKTTQSRRLQ